MDIIQDLQVALNQLDNLNLANNRAVDLSVETDRMHPPNTHLTFFPNDHKFRAYPALNQTTSLLNQLRGFCISAANSYSSNQANSQEKVILFAYIFYTTHRHDSNIELKLAFSCGIDQNTYDLIFMIITDIKNDIFFVVNIEHGICVDSNFTTYRLIPYHYNFLEDMQLIGLVHNIKDKKLKLSNTFTFNLQSSDAFVEMTCAYIDILQEKDRFIEFNKVIFSHLKNGEFSKIIEFFINDSHLLNELFLLEDEEIFPCTILSTLLKAQYYHPESVYKILELGANLFVTDQDGNTPLLQFIELLKAREPTHIEILILMYIIDNAPATIDYANDFYILPFSLADKYGNKIILDILNSYHACQNLRQKEQTFSLRSAEIHYSNLAEECEYINREEPSSPSIVFELDEEEHVPKETSIAKPKIS